MYSEMKTSEMGNKSKARGGVSGGKSEDQELVGFSRSHTEVVQSWDKTSSVICCLYHGPSLVLMDTVSLNSVMVPTPTGYLRFSGILSLKEDSSQWNLGHLTSVSRNLCYGVLRLHSPRRHQDCILFFVTFPSLLPEQHSALDYKTIKQTNFQTTQQFPCHWI